MGTGRSTIILFFFLKSDLSSKFINILIKVNPLYLKPNLSETDGTICKMQLPVLFYCCQTVSFTSKADCHPSSRIAGLHPHATQSTTIKTIVNQSYTSNEVWNSLKYLLWQHPELQQHRREKAEGTVWHQ